MVLVTRKILFKNDKNHARPYAVAVLNSINATINLKITENMINHVFNAQTLRRSFFGLSGLYMLGIPLLLLANIVLARTLSVAEFGAFGFAISLATVLAIPVAGGLTMLLTREVAVYVQNGDWPAYRGIIAAAHSWVLFISGVIILSILIWWAIYPKTLRVELLFAFLLVPFLALNGIRNGILKGLGRPLLAEAPTQVMQPTLMILGYLALAALGVSSVTNILLWYLMTVAGTFAVASLILVKVQPVVLASITSDFQDLPRWRKAALPFALMGAATVLSTQVAVFISGILGENEVVAYLRVAERGAMMVIIPFHILGAILGPHIVQAIKSGNIESQKKVVQHSSRLMFFAALPFAIVMIAGGTYILKFLFGEPYDQYAYLPMIIIASTQVIAMSFGHGGMFLTMGGREKLAFVSQAVALLVSIGLCLLLIGEYGATGAALSVSAGVITSTVINVALVRYFFGFTPGIL